MSDLINRSESFMNDLIRRKDVLALFPINDCSDKMVGLYEKVLDVPTSYNPGKVVEELEKRSKEYNSGVRLHGKPEEMLTHEAIDIVKRGGVE